MKSPLDGELDPRWASDFSRGVMGYLEHVDRFQVQERAGNAAAPTGADQDAQWGASFEGAPLRLHHIIAVTVMGAASQHLRALAALVPMEGVDLGVEVTARGCCEASARVLWVLDLDVEPKDRAVRALNTVWGTANTHDIIDKEVTRLGLRYKVNKGLFALERGVGC